jgi:hypothetical protein
MLEDISDVGSFLACVGEKCPFVFGNLYVVFVLCCWGFLSGVTENELL